MAEASSATSQEAPLVVVAPYLSEATQARLRERGLGYLDLTGNVRVVVSEPGLFIETQGAATAPDREDRPARSLRGARRRLARVLMAIGNTRPHMSRLLT